MSSAGTIEDRSTVPGILGSDTAFTEVKFKLLGPLEILRGGEDYAPTAPKVLQLLALLVLHPNRVVQLDSIVDELWGTNPPRSVRTTTQTYVYHLRRCIEVNELAADGEAMVATKPPGYVLRVDPAHVDVSTFEQRCRDGKAALAQQRYDDAATLFRSALALWSGPPLANVNRGPVLSSHVVNLQEQHRNALHLRVEAEIEGGARGELVGELRGLATANPLDERLHGQLMRVLGRSGRRSDAMATYRQLRGNLHSELGVEPCDELRILHQELLSAGDVIG